MGFIFVSLSPSDESKLLREGLNFAEGGKLPDADLVVSRLLYVKPLSSFD